MFWVCLNRDRYVRNVPVYGCNYSERIIEEPEVKQLLDFVCPECGAAMIIVDNIEALNDMRSTHESLEGDQN